MIVYQRVPTINQSATIQKPNTTTSTPSVKSHGSTSTSNDENLFLFIKDQAFHLTLAGKVAKEILQIQSIKFTINIDYKTLSDRSLGVINDLCLESGMGITRILRIPPIAERVSVWIPGCAGVASQAHHGIGFSHLPSLQDSSGM